MDTATLVKIKFFPFPSFHHNPRAAGEIGQLDEWLNPREYSWTNKVNLLFIDNPVGAGYSYVDNSSLYTTTVEEIAADLLTCHQFLVLELPFMTDMPYWIFSESVLDPPSPFLAKNTEYGGKITAALGNTL